MRALSLGAVTFIILFVASPALADHGGSSRPVGFLPFVTALWLAYAGLVGAGGGGTPRAAVAIVGAVIAVVVVFLAVFDIGGLSGPVSALMWALLASMTAVDLVRWRVGLESARRSLWGHLAIWGSGLAVGSFVFFGQFQAVISWPGRDWLFTLLVVTVLLVLMFVPLRLRNLATRRAPAWAAAFCLGIGAAIPGALLQLPRQAATLQESYYGWWLSKGLVEVLNACPPQRQAPNGAWLAAAGCRASLDVPLFTVRVLLSDADRMVLSAEETGAGHGGRRFYLYDSRLLAGRLESGLGGWFQLSHRSGSYPTAAQIQPDWTRLLGVNSLEELLAADVRRIPRDLLAAYAGGLVLLLLGGLLLLFLRAETGRLPIQA